MVQAVGSFHNVSYAEKIARQYRSADPAAASRAAAIVDTVTISPEAQAMHKAISEAINGGQTPQSLKPGGLSKLPDWSFNYDKASQRAETGLKAAMQQLGIPPETHVSMKTNTDGTITVESNSSKNAELEAIVNSNMELRNALIATQSSAYMGRIGDAVSQAQSAMDANPSKADYYNNWLVGVAQRITSMGFVFDFTDGKLSGSFLSNGKKIGLMENLERLPA